MKLVAALIVLLIQVTEAFGQRYEYFLLDPDTTHFNDIEKGSVYPRLADSDLAQKKDRIFIRCQFQSFPGGLANLSQTSDKPLIYDSPPGVILANRQFSRKLTFYDCDILNGYVSAAHIGNRLSFNRSRLIGNTQFFFSTIDSLADFTECSFDRLIFDNCSIKGYTSFSYSASQTLALSYCNFLSDLDFDYASVINVLRMSNVDFSPTATVDFSHAFLPDTIILSNISHISNDIDLTAADLNFRDRYGKKKILICLYNSELSKIKIDYIHFKLYFPDTLFNVRNSTQYEVKEVDDKEAVYESLLQNFQSRGQKESYRLLDIAYRKFKYNQHWYTVPLSWINDLWWNYGYSKGRVFFWALVFIILFTIINYFILYHLNENVYKMENMPIREDPHTFGSQMWFSFVYTSSIFFRLTLKMENLMFRNKAGTAYLIVIFTLGIICLAYMANFVLQK